MHFKGVLTTIVCSLSICILERRRQRIQVIVFLDKRTKEQKNIVSKSPIIGFHSYVLLFFCLKINPIKSLLWGNHMYGCILYHPAFKSRSTGKQQPLTTEPDVANSRKSHIAGSGQREERFVQLHRLKIGQ